MIYPSATLKLIPESATQAHIVPRAIILHSAGGKGSLYGFWLNSSDLECHFWVSETGVVEQYMSTTTRADANLHANSFAVSIETESTVSASEPWTQAQLDAIIKLCDWLCTTHNIPREQIASPVGSGIGWHVMWGAPGEWTPAKGKVCPGPKRIEQTKNVVIPAVAKMATQTPTTDEGWLMALSDKEQKELYLWTAALYQAVIDGEKAPKNNILKRIRDGIARIEAK